MSKHYNLYYLLQEDQRKHQMSEAARNRIQSHLESFYHEMKPPWKGHETDPPREKNGGDK